MRVAVAARYEKKYEHYQHAVERAGLEAVMFEPAGGASLEGVAGLVLTGGNDVDPGLYSAVPLPETDPPDRERDEFESALLRTALKRDLPVLAICRGLQLFNVVCGGTLIQDLPHPNKHRDPSGGRPVHGIHIEAGRIAEILGARDVAVNSRHHQAADRVGDGLVVTARADDGVIEGMEYGAARFAVAVQWHPEDMTEDEHQPRLFEAFARAVTQR